jgi:hypothetical protein
VKLVLLAADAVKVDNVRWDYAGWRKIINDISITAL